MPDQSEHEKVDALLDLSQIGMELSDGYAPVPEQSTLALVAHHPQAFYFGMKQGKLKPLDAVSPDDIIKGSKRDPSLFAEADAEELDSDPLDGGVAEEDAPGRAPAAVASASGRFDEVQLEDRAKRLGRQAQAVAGAQRVGRRGHRLDRDDRAAGGVKSCRWV